LLAPPLQLKTEIVIGWTPTPTGIPAGGHCENCAGPQLPAKQPELVSDERSGMNALQAFVVSNGATAFDMQTQSTNGGVLSRTVTVWLQVLVFPHISARIQVRVTRIGHVPLVTVLATVTVTFVPLQLSKAVGGSKVQVVPQETVLLVACALQRALTETSS
jgi:hypothetical protein